MSSTRGSATVRLTVMQSEPLARLAEQRLRREGIRCFVRPLGVGPGGWGTAADLPHGVYVKQADEMRARQLLELPPQEIIEREGGRPGPTNSRRATFTLVVLLAVATVLGSVALIVQGIFR